MSIQTRIFSCQGGLNAESPPLSIAPGSLVYCVNFESGLSGGYTRMQGYQAFDGRTSGTVLAVPGSGQVRGVWFYNDKVYAFRNAVGGATCVMFESAAGGWTSRQTGLAPNGTYEFANYNFTGALTSAKMYGVSGVHKGFEWDGTTFTDITTGSSPDTPEHISAHKNHLFYAFGASLQNSGIGTPGTWMLRSGASDIGIGEPINGLLSYRGDTLAVFGKNKTMMLYGSSNANWALKTLSSSGGGVSRTQSELAGDGFVSSESGLVSLASTQDFGDFVTAVVSKQIKRLFPGRNALFAITVRTKQQVRVYFNDKSVITATVVNGENGKAIEYTRQVLDHQFTCGCSAIDSAGNEVIFAGADDGFVYQLDTGTSFAGQPFTSTLRLPFNYLNGISQKKRMRKVRLELDAPAAFTFDVGIDFNYGTTEPSNYGSLDATAGGALYGAAVYGASTYGGGLSGLCEVNVQGVGQNISMLVSHTSATDAAWTLNAVIVEYNLIGRQK
jgi:hypothetical protein